MDKETNKMNEEPEKKCRTQDMRTKKAKRLLGCSGELLDRYLKPCRIERRGRGIPVRFYSRDQVLALQRRKEFQADLEKDRRQTKARKEVTAVYEGSDRVATTKLYRELQKNGQTGWVAAQLLRCQKSSSKAKVYRRGPKPGLSYRDLAYRNKAKSMKKLCELFWQDSCGFRWGWGTDKMEPSIPHVLYIDLPNGQVSFHSQERYEGPDYPGNWDGAKASEERIILFAGDVLVIHGGGDGCQLALSVDVASLIA